MFCSRDYTEVSFCVTTLRLGCASGVLSKQIQFIESHHTPLHREERFGNTSQKKFFCVFEQIQTSSSTTPFFYCDRSL